MNLSKHTRLTHRFFPRQNARDDRQLGAISHSSWASIIWLETFAVSNRLLRTIATGSAGEPRSGTVQLLEDCFGCVVQHLGEPQNCVANLWTKFTAFDCYAMGANV